MNATNVLALFSKLPEPLYRDIEKLPAKNRKTAKALLEAAVKLAYILYAAGNRAGAADIVESISDIPFANDYRYWTWIDAALVLQGKIASEHGNDQLHQLALSKATTALNTGTPLQMTVKASVQKRFLDGQTLGDVSEDVNAGFDSLITNLMTLLRMEFFGGSSTWPVSAIDARASVTMQNLDNMITATGLHNLPPFR